MPPSREKATAKGTSTTLSMAEAMRGMGNRLPATSQDTSTSSGSTVADAGTRAISSNP